MVCGSGYKEVPRVLQTFSFLIWVLVTMSSVCEIHQPVHWCSVNFNTSLYFNTKVFPVLFFFLIIWDSFWHVNIFSKGEFSFLKWFNHNLCKKRNLYLQMMSLMASTHWGANNLEKGPRGKVRNLDGGGDMDVFVSVSVGPLSRDSDPCQCGRPLTVPSIIFQELWEIKLGSLSDLPVPCWSSPCLPH